MGKSHLHKYKQVIQGSERIVREQVGIRNGRPVFKKRLVKLNSGRVIYRCILPGCHHYIPIEMMEGREFECWNCGGKGVFTKEMKTLEKPRHHECRVGNNNDTSNN